eukprot:1194701-Prorocentrum_minimum.AAC.3
MFYGLFATQVFTAPSSCHSCVSAYGHNSGGCATGRRVTRALLADVDVGSRAAPMRSRRWTV